MISEGSHDTEDWNNNTATKLLLTDIEWHQRNWFIDATYPDKLYTNTVYSWNQMILEQHACYNLPLWHVLRVDMLNAILVPVKSAYKANEVMNELINEPLQTGASSSWAQRIPRGYTMTRRTNSLPSHTGSDK